MNNIWLRPGNRSSDYQRMAPRVNLQPKVTIVTPSYNQGRYLSTTIESVLDQNYGNLEYIVIDGDSRDESRKILEKYDRHISFWESVPDLGQSHALNKGFARSTGDIMGWINADDQLEPGALMTISETLVDTASPAWLIGGTRITNNRGTTMDTRLPKPVTPMTFYTWPTNWFPQQSTYWNRAIWDRAGPLREDLHYIMDCALWNRMYEISKPILSENILAAYRMHNEAKCVARREDAIQEYKEYFRAILEQGCETADRAALASKIEELTSDFLEMQQELWRAEARIERVRRHGVFGPLTRLWRRLVNKDFDV